MRIEDFAAALCEIHPNAMVAWDRDGAELPDSDNLEIHAWGEDRHWMIDMDHEMRDDGLGCVLFRAEAPPGFVGDLHRFRAVLTSDTTNDLGCRWIVC